MSDISDELTVNDLEKVMEDDQEMTLEVDNQTERQSSSIPEDEQKPEKPSIFAFQVSSKQEQKVRKLALDSEYRQAINRGGDILVHQDELPGKSDSDEKEASDSSSDSSDEGTFNENKVKKFKKPKLIQEKQKSLRPAIKKKQDSESDEE